eukprot:Protomagalhaensia_wolfi_Nauph_80__5839@NODE_739_length_2049_cov_14_502488_g553_i0_p1_GENE_NODE_739_length_2049_cov_14_502488_g553_i0NODE_739_length_2049_cov_14_502488_g553_i0_p1_ORF_typecomplete_len335_score34_93TPR_11/PF13414_6/0_026TPR_11/PF13414_6/2_1e02TPR_11/PF13414_6/0_00029TPR_11/PF13414_6/0_13TPR_11/PF13414_6/6_3e02TPR_11/PF13414_6/0_0095TPR_11/PF13414_6/8_6TPR_16/PF13432_6/1_1TPR_16/PF13432_6/0_0021TPR_16/PF13432_6/0_0041TPR_16/PF13432_6/0_00032TPR_19/PF14559_6/0_0055TPR_19/PF14559_6/0_
MSKFPIPFPEADTKTVASVNPTRYRVHLQASVVEIQPATMVEMGTSTKSWYGAKLAEVKGDDSYAQADYTMAIHHYKEACSLDPKEHMYQFKSACAHLLSNRFWGCKQFIHTIVSELNDYTEAIAKHEKLGLEHLEQEQYLQAINEFSIAISRDPSNPSYWIGRSKAKYSFEELTPQKVVTRHRGSPLRVDSYPPQKPFSPGLEDAGVALQLDPRNAWAWFWRGRFLQSEYKTDDATYAFSRATLYEPRSALFWTYKGCYVPYAKTRSEMEASTEFKAIEKALSLDPNMALAWYYKGQHYEEYVESLSEARSCYKRAYQLEPTNSLYKQLAANT